MRWLRRIYRWAFPPIPPFHERMRLARLYGNKVATGEMTEEQARQELRQRHNVWV